MAEDLILKASLDTAEAEADAQKLKSSLAKVDGVSTSSNAGKALATNMNSAKVASDAMFRSLQAMGGPLGRMASMMKAFSDSARMLQTIPSGPGGPGGAQRTGWQAANVASNLGGGVMAGGVASAGIDGLKTNAELWLKELHNEFKADPTQFGSNPLSEMRTLAKQYGKIGAPLDPSRPDTFAAYGSITTANGSLIGLDKLETASLGAQSKLGSLAGKLSQATMVIGAFAAAVAAGLWLQKKIFQTESQRESARKASLAEFNSWTKDRAFGRIMQRGTEEQKRKAVETEIGKADEQLDAISAWRAANAKVKQAHAAAGRQWTQSGYDAALAKEKVVSEEREAALRKMESGGAKLDRNWNRLASPESVEAWWTEQSKKKAGLEDTRLDLDLAKKALSKLTPRAPVTDELTRIGGSIGGGIDYQRSMANSLLSIDRAVAIIRASVTAKSTTYI